MAVLASSGEADTKKTPLTKSGEKQSISTSAAHHPAMATVHNDDERLLMRIGYRQELRREFTKWSTVSYAISILGVLGSVPATIGAPLSSGGPATAVWAWFLGSIMAMCIASSGMLPCICTKWILV